MNISSERLRLKVSTSTGLNIMCSASKEWKVDTLYSYLERLYG